LSVNYGVYVNKTEDDSCAKVEYLLKFDIRKKKTNSPRKLKEGFIVFENQSYTKYYACS
jgi:hypothetical protein